MTVNALCAGATAVVNDLLEAEDHDAHIKAYNRIQKLDQAYASYGELAKLRQKADATYRELGQAIGLDRNLAKAGLTRDEVEHYIRGEQVVATDRHKISVPARVCIGPNCHMKGTAQTGTADCAGCGDPLQAGTARASAWHLRNKMSKHIVGVVAQDGRRIFFADAVAPRT